MSLTTKINKYFRIKVKSTGSKSRLIGAGTFIKYVGKEMANKLFSEAFNSDQYKYTRKLRRGLKIDFYSK